MLQVIEGEGLMVLPHVLSGRNGINISGDFEHSEGDLYSLGEEVFQTADSPAQRQLFPIEESSLFILNDNIQHSRTLLHLVHFHFLLYDLLDLFFL
jgi:hypothetical protein